MNSATNPSRARSTRVLLGLVTLALLALPLSAGRGGGDDAYTMWGLFHHDFGGADDTLTVAYLTGQRVQSNGRAAFAASYEEGSSIGAFNAFGVLPPALHDAENDIIVVVLRSHGRYEKRDEQITFGEFLDCDTCEDVQWACWLPGGPSTVDVRRGTDLCDGAGLGDPVVKHSAATLEREVDAFGNVVPGIRVAVHTRVP